MRKNLALFLDGTWNEPGDNTNVWRLKVLLAGETPAGIPQVAYYHVGVGTRRSDRLRGGVAGSGLSTNVRDAYQWLIEQYNPGDEVFIFGFSRGAYTARSLAGLIVKCGLLYPGVPMTALEVYTRYQLGKQARPLYEIEYDVQCGKTLVDTEEKRLLSYSRRIPIQMIGVWDTVGSLGIPWTQAHLIGRGHFFFHNTNLSKLFEHAFHAMAIDENRSPYKPTLWTQYIPAGGPPKPPPERTKVEQRWFVGAHCNVGGGYTRDELAQLPLAWLQSKARECGLAFRAGVGLHGDEILYAPRDSYAEFLHGCWRVLNLGRRFWRSIDSTPLSVRGGTSLPVNQVIDASVFERCRRVPVYRPANLVEWAARKRVDLATAVGDRDV
jgi:uncharacterized protein (DUF2235 family)